MVGIFVSCEGTGGQQGAKDAEVTGEAAAAAGQYVFLLLSKH
jgi:hypothetical protein